MKTYLTVSVAMLTGMAIGGFAVQGLQAQAKPPVYVIGEIDVTNEDGYAKEYVPKAQALIKASGGRILAAGGAAGGTQLVPVEGTPPKKRVVIQVWDSVEQIKAWHDSAAYKENRKIGDKHAKFLLFAIPGMAQ